jgi:hypothetical protein
LEALIPDLVAKSALWLAMELPPMEAEEVILKWLVGRHTPRVGTSQ